MDKFGMLITNKAWESNAIKMGAKILVHVALKNFL